MSAPPPKPHDSGDKEPSTYFEIEQARLDNPGEAKVGGTVHQLPPLPASSPWAGDPVGPEPTINREEDGDTIDINQER
jgi:hypothetical protein